jgi:hypothetical protein
MRRGQEHDVPGLPGDPLHGGRDGAGRGGPDEEHLIHAVQAFLQRLGSGEIAARDLDFRRQTGGARIAGQRADSGVRGHQSRDHLAADRSGGPRDEDSLHPGILQAERDPEAT